MHKNLGTIVLLAVSSALGAHCAYGVEPERPAGETGGSDTGPGTGGATGGTTASTGGTTTSTGGTTTSTGGGGAGGATSSTGGGGAGGATSGTGGTGGWSGGVVPGGLQNLPPQCIPCQTMNQSDKPKCQEYLDCYIANLCEPVDACGQLDGVCGVNTIGGGNAPRDAAIATYMCACQ